VLPAKTSQHLGCGFFLRIDWLPKSWFLGTTQLTFPSGHCSQRPIKIHAVLFIQVSHMVVKRSDGLSSPLFTFIHMPHLVRFTSRLLILYFFDTRKITAAVNDAKRLTAVFIIHAVWALGTES